MLHARGMVFGVFDGLHEGHRHFLESAKRKCGELTVVVATDEAARALKGRAPAVPLASRMATIKAFKPSVKVVAGDETNGSWTILGTHTADMVFLGYDQQAIAKELDLRGIPYMYLVAHEPKRFKSSVLRDAK